MDPEFMLLINDELKALTDQENAIRNSGVSDAEKSQRMASLTAYANMIIGMGEWLPTFYEHLLQNKKLRGET